MTVTVPTSSVPLMTSVRSTTEMSDMSMYPKPKP